MTDGTSAGTLPLGDLNPGSPSSLGWLNSVALGSKALFRADDGIHGPEWWLSEGTPASTRMVKDLCKGRSARGRASRPR